uniref:DnaJ subfamily C member 13 n=1 Tax=Lygus hesperus TaxID=30085 RepID=A0A146KY70_LYGHE
MMALPDNEDRVCFYVTKHSWKGRYKRIFSFGTSGVTTYNPESLEITNRWPYTDIASIRRATDNGEKFKITVKKDKTRKIDTMNFSTEHRSELITTAFKYSHLFLEKTHENQRYEAQKQHWSGILLPTVLDVTPASLNQIDVATHDVLASYAYKDIEAIFDLNDVPGGFIVTMKVTGRMHMFVTPRREEIKRKLEEYSQLYLAVDVKLQNKPVTIQYFHENRLGKYSDDEYTTSTVEFTVLKTDTPRHQDSPPRLLCLSQTCIIERDPESYHVVTCRPLVTVMSLIRDEQNPRQFKIEYEDGSLRTYQGANRDSILATLIDCVRGEGNKNVHVKMKETSRGKRLGPLHSHLEAEVEAAHLKLLRDSIGKKNMADAVERFNCNVPYSGLLHSVTQDGLFKDNRERPILEVLQAIVRCKESFDFDTFCDEEIEALYQCIRRLVASKIGFQAFTQQPGLRESLGLLVVRGLNKDSEALTYAAVDMLCALMHPMHDDYDLKQEQHNKSSLLGNVNFLNSLLDKWSNYALSGSGALVVCAVLDFLTFALCHPYSETTEGRNFDSLLELMTKRGRALFKHFQHPCLTIVKGASLIMRAIIEEGESEVASHMQELALSESALLRHLLIAFFTSKTDKPRLGQCRISRQLISLWLANNDNGNLLMQKLLPGGLLAFLDSTDTAPADDLDNNIRDNLKLAQDHANKNQRNPQLLALEKQLKIFEKHLESTLVHWGARIGIDKRQDKFKMAPVTLRKSRQKVKSTHNWALFFYKFNQDHFLPNLIWNHKTRDELKTALDKEIKSFDANREISSNSIIAWNYAEFEVNYPSLKDQLCIDGYYIKILLDRREAPESLVKTSLVFFNNLYHRFLLPTTSDMKCMCLQALAFVYEKYYEVIGYFSDTKYIVSMLERTIDRSERDRLLMFLHALTFNKDNVKEIVVNSNGIEVLVDLMTLAHLHTSRAILPTQSNVIEYGSFTDREQEKEWHYCTSSDGSKTSDTKISFKDLKKLYADGVIKKDTKCWAQGMHNWKPVVNITQLKWTLVARGTPILNESDLTVLILNMLINMINYYPCRNKEGAIIWPMSRIKQILSNEHCLHHIVQLLLTFDPVIVEKVATLIYSIAEDNVFMPKLYTTGVFFFILMYNGSNVLPIARFLKLTHSKQAFRGEEGYGSELMQRSILGQLLPEAMIYYLENHGPEKFAQIFLGEFDTPEAIWNSEMRTMLIQKIAAHIADFTPRLWSNNRARYEYLVIPVVRYPQLQNELFCNIFYLRHLCDTTKFPNWPIADPVCVLRDVLEAWTSEVQKKPPAMSVEEAYSLLELPSGRDHHDEPTIRKAYYRLAQKYHPDKNSQGRVKFEAVNKAYDFLCSRSPWMDNGVNTNNIVLILKTQSILFHRYSAALQPYKYAGYKQLIKTIQLETADERLFSKQTSLLSAAIELIYHTIQCSTLNAEEFNREHGFQVASEAFSRCVSVLSNTLKDGNPVCTICLNCVRIYTIAASFENCRHTFKQLNNIIPDLVRILHFKSLFKLTCAVVECITALSIDPDLQITLLQGGVLWYILSYLFLYDYTLHESGVESTKEANQQEVWNEIAKLSIKACACIAGYASENSSSPHNIKVKKALETLMTPYLAGLISEDQPEQILKTMTSNCETPYLLWDNTTRAELIEFLDQRIASKSPFNLDSIEFSFSSHSSELVVGGIFIRIYNDQPTFKIQDPKRFVVDILDYLKQYNSPCLRDSEVRNLVMILTSLYNVVQNNQGTALQCIGHFRFIFAFLAMDAYESIQAKTLSVIALLARNQECVNDIAASGVLASLLLVLYSLPNHRMVALDCLHSLVTSSAIVKDLISKGSLPYLIDIVMNSKNLEIRVRAAELLGRLMEDKVSGPRVKLLLLQMLPSAICDGFLESPQTTINIIQTNQENPEMIWNDNDRLHLSTVIANHCKRQHLNQRQNPDVVCQMPDIKVVSAGNSNELIVGDVYLRLYNQNPAWSLRKPVKFLGDLLDTFLKLMSKPHESALEAVGKALTNVLTYNPGLVSEVPSMGHLPKMFSTWKVPNQLVSFHTFRVLDLIFANESCVDSLNRSRVDCIVPMKNAMCAHSELITVGCDSLSKLSEFKVDNLIKQALECDFINYLLKLLGDSLLQCENPARTKAIIVKTLKNLAASPFNGAAVAAILDRSSIWPSFREQNHDLFITSGSSPAYLTGGPATAGYLTQGSKPMPTAPPPVEKDDIE